MGVYCSVFFHRAKKMWILGSNETSARGGGWPRGLAGAAKARLSPVVVRCRLFAPTKRLGSSDYIFKLRGPQNKDERTRVMRAEGGGKIYGTIPYILSAGSIKSWIHTLHSMPRTEPKHETHPTRLRYSFTVGLARGRVGVEDGGKKGCRWNEPFAVDSARAGVPELGVGRADGA